MGVALRGAVARLELLPAQAVALAGVKLAQVTVVLHGEVPQGGCDDLRGLLGSGENAGVERDGARQLARRRQAVSEGLRLSDTELGKPRTALRSSDDPVDVALGLPMADQDESCDRPVEATHARVSTKCSSCFRFRHSKAPSQWTAYSERIESPVSQ